MLTRFISGLILAADAGNREMVGLLLGAGEDVNYASDTGETALSAACYDGNVEVVELLLQRGADAAHVDRFGVSILDNASNHPKLIHLLKQYLAQRQ